MIYNLLFDTNFMNFHYFNIEIIPVDFSVAVLFLYDNWPMVLRQKLPVRFPQLVMWK